MKDIELKNISNGIERIEEKFNKEKPRGGKIHFITSHSHIVFLLAVLAGIVFDLLIPFEIFSGKLYQYIGLGLIVLGSVFTYWTHKSSDIIEKDDNSFNFQRGPYKHLRNPGYLSLFIMTLGLALLIDSPFSILFVLFAYIFTKFFFVKKEERILEKKYGEEYLVYKKKTKNHL